MTRKISEKQVHLFEGFDENAIPASWCGEGENETAELISEVTCLDCLKLVGQVGAKANKRYMELTDEF